MSFSNFIYRQKQKILYHTSRNEVKKRIAEINRFKEIVRASKHGYYVKEIDFVLPLTGFDFIFANDSFDLFITNAKELEGSYSIDNEGLFFSFSRYKVEITSGSELFILNEIFVNKCYNFKLPCDTPIIIVDMGMNVGLASLFFANHSQVESVFSYEPFLPTIKMAMRNFDLNPSIKHKIFVHNYGLGDKNQILSAKFDLQNSGINSTLIVNPRVKSDVIEKLEIRNAYSELKKLIDKFPKRKFIIKIDTEGAEYSILESIFSPKLNDAIIGFFIEWHFNGSDSLELRLVKEGFKLVSFNLSAEAGLIYAFR